MIYRQGYVPNIISLNQFLFGTDPCPNVPMPRGPYSALIFIEHLLSALKLYLT